MVSVNFWVILISATNGLLTVFLSALVPALKASYISPITATKCLGLSGGVYIFHRIVNTDIQIAFKLPINYIGIATVGCLIITFLSTLSPLKKIEEDNIMESIRVEE
jgi:ABC-type antimicrobial peptide transport system permease subunit